MTGLLRRHWLLCLLLVAGITLRVLVWLAYQPALLYIDSFRYLANVDALRPDHLNPLGYDLVLAPLLAIGGLAFTAAVQHVLGLAVAVALYALALRHNVPRWVAAIVAGIVLLDGYQLQIEQNIMSEIWFQALLVGMLWLLLGRGEPNWRRSAVAGLLLGAAMMTRTIGVTILVPVVLYLIVAGGAWRNRAGWHRIAVRGTACLLGFAVVVGSYAGYFRSVTGEWGLTGASSHVLYGRMATIAKCDQLPLDETLKRFCPSTPVEERKGVDYYTHFVYGDSDWPGALPPGRSKQQLADEFGMIVLRNQPVDLAVAVLKDFAKNFAPTKTTSPNDVPVDRWQFQLEYPDFDGAIDPAAFDKTALIHDGVRTSADEDLARFLRDYQLSVGYTPGPLLALAGLLGLAAAAGVGRARRSGLRSAALLTTGSGLIILLGSAAFEFSWRYQLPALVLLPLGGAIGLTALLGRRMPAPARRRVKLAAFPDDVDKAAMREFRERYGDSPLSQLVVVIAAYNEADGIGTVLRNMPTRCGELPVSVLVVVDGATDDTAKVAAENGALVCVAPRNRGQGAALRLGYHLAAAGGADYVVTTDADGQYDNAELPLLMRPLLDGRADFVTGSRRLGSEQADSRVRWLGVRVFAGLASILTWRRITDTSFGFRAMRAELACSVTLREPQYQSSELLLGVLARRARVVELPMSMRLRGNGKSKKGHSLVYGANYARVMTGTWLREYVLRRLRRHSVRH
ncbi:Glycosyl transferase family 2 [Amycolatopsis marina]|uniref:Glycosyl transferase family 2 n=1 Tax=Amycolatopsis marina TaxID=490629 RepID=A0A1I0VPK2_9PSEU|nr:glycosyltransferase family 2 protein [Amycolatopsis marina]SFA77596.1 Glycosyl transferase family 2 [Amycolatopsis marina]